MSDGIIAPQRRIRGLMDDHETLVATLVTDETKEGWYVLVVRRWNHPDESVNGDILNERYAYLTKGHGNDGWVSGGDGGGAAGINRRWAGESGRLAGSLAKAYLHAAKMEDGQTDDAVHTNLVSE